MSKLVKLPLDAANKLDQLRDFGYSTETIVACRNDPSSNYDILRTIPFETFLSALVNGYTRDKTESERHAELLEYYRYHNDKSDERCEVIRHTVVTTLNILGITIEQINGGAC